MNRTDISTPSVSISRHDAIRLISLSVLLSDGALELLGSDEYVAAAEKAIHEIGQTLARQVGSDA